MDSQTDTEAHRQTQTLTDRKRDSQTDTDAHTHRHTKRLTDRHRNSQTDARVDNPTA